MCNEAKLALCMMQVSLSDKIREYAQSLLCHVQLDADNAAGEGYVLLVAMLRALGGAVESCAFSKCKSMCRRSPHLAS